MESGAITLFLSVVLVVIGLVKVGEWVSDWWHGKMGKMPFSIKEFTVAVEARFPTVVTARVLEGPSLTKGTRRRPVVDRMLLLTDKSGAMCAVDVSWLGRFSLADSLLRLTLDLANAVDVSVVKSDAGNTKKSEEKVVLPSSMRAGLLASIRGSSSMRL